MADGYIAIDEPTAVDKKLDTTELTVGANTVQRERVQIAGSSAAEIAPVSATDGLLVNLGTNNDVTVSGVATEAKQDTQVTHLATLAGAVKAEDDASANADPGVVILAKRSDTPAATSGLDGDYEPLQVTAGRLAVDGSGVTQPVSNAGLTSLAGAISGTEVQVDVLTLPAIPAGTNNIGDVDIASIAAGDNNIGNVDIASIAAGDNNIGNVDIVTMPGVAGDVAHDGADSGNPVKVGGKAVSSEPAAVAANDRANLITDLVGKLITLPYANPENFVSGAITTAMTGTTSTSLVAAPGAGLRNYITTIIVSNAHATVGTDVVIQDGSGGTTLLTIPAAAVYGGAVINLPVPLRQPTANTAIYCANVTTGASTKVSAVGYKGA